MPHRPLRILTWHVHGNYLYYLSQVPHEWYVLSKEDRSPGYAGRSGALPWGDNVFDLPVEELAHRDFDLVLYQSHRHWQEDRNTLLAERHRRLPRIFLEHDPPQEHPTNTRHPVQDPGALLVHVTHFNDLMWDNGLTPTRVVEHGVLVPPEAAYRGVKDRGIVVVNNMRKRGRRLGADLYREARHHVPLDLIGMDAEAEGGLGEVVNVDVPGFIADYRFFFHTCRYTSLGLAACEAMMIGLPIVAPATTEIVTVIRNGENGFIHTDRQALVECMRELIAHPDLARRLGRNARETARERFGMERFVNDWLAAIDEAMEGGAMRELRRKRVLVTGGAGFLGSHLCERLVERGQDVLCVDNFYTGDKHNIAGLLAAHNFELLRHDVTFPLYVEVDEIYNLACPASPIHYQFDPVQTTKTSVHGAINMLGLAKRVKARILQASTSEVYGDPQVHPQTEEYWGHVNPNGLRACYDEGKRCAETLFMDYRRQHGVEVKVARIFNTYGPRMHPNDGRVVSNFILQALQDAPITLYGSGAQTRSFCYVDDLVEGLMRFMETPAEVCGPMNLGNPHEVTVRELAETIVALTGSKSEIVEKPLPADDPTQRCPDIARAKKALGWQPYVPLEAGLRKTIAYFRDQLRRESGSDAGRLAA